MAIPLVIVVLFMGMAMVSLYLTTLRENRVLDSMAEEDLKSLYIAESGARIFISRLRKLGGWPNRPWKQEGSSWTEGGDFGYKSATTKGTYQIFAEEIWSRGEFSHVFVLVRGILQVADRQNVTVLKTTLRWTPPPPVPDGTPQTLVASPGRQINASELLRYISDPRFHSAFLVNGEIPPSMRALMDYLKEGRLEDLDFEENRGLVAAAARMESINEQVDRLLHMLQIARDPHYDLRIEKVKRELEEDASPDSLLTAFGDFPSVLSELDEDKNALEALQRMFESITPEKRSQMERVLLIEKLRSLGNRGVRVDQSANLPFGLSSEATAEELANEIEKLSLASPGSLGVLLRRMAAAGIKLDMGAGNHLGSESFAWMIQPDIRADQGLVDQLNDDGSPRTPPGDSQIPPVPDSKDTRSEKDSSDSGQPTGNEGASEKSSAQTKEDSEASDGEPNWINLSEEEYDKALKQLYGTDNSIFDGLDENPGSMNSGLRSVYRKLVRDELEIFVLSRMQAMGRGPTLQELRAFRANNPIPEGDLVRQVGNTLDNLVESGEWTFFQDAHVRNLSSRAVRYTQIEIPRESFAQEMMLKLETLPSNQRPRTNEQFLQMFENSTWGDDPAHFSVGVVKDQNGKPLESRWFMINKESGQKVYLSDYLRENTDN